MTGTDRNTVRRIVRLAEEAESEARRRGPMKASCSRYGSEWVGPVQPWLPAGPSSS